MKWIFEGRVYSSLEELSGKTMSEGNQPEPIFSLEEMKEWGLITMRYGAGYDDAVKPPVYFKQKFGFIL